MALGLALYPNNGLIARPNQSDDADNAAATSTHYLMRG